MATPSSHPAGLVDGSLIASLRALDRDGRRLFAMRLARMFAYGSIAVVLVLYLAEAGLDALAIGILLTLTLVGDAVISLVLTTHADRIGRRRVLALGGLLMVIGGVIFATTDLLPFLLLAGIIGVISPTGSEVGPFLAVEQAALSQVTADRRRTAVFAWYNVAGYLAVAVGSLAAGLVSQALLASGASPLDAYRAVVVGYAAIGLALVAIAWTLGPGIEVVAAPDDGLRRRLGLGRSRSIVARLSALFALDAFGGGFIPQSLIAYWLHLAFGVEPAGLGAIFFVTNVLAAVSALSAARIAARIGLIRTMVFTHLPSNVLLILLPFMPTLPLAVVTLLARSLLSQMDVPTRQSYVMAVVDPDERSAAAGVTGIARTFGSAVSPSLSSVLMASAGYVAAPFVLAGGLKIVYDLLLYRDFRSVRPPEEQPTVTVSPERPAGA